MIVVCPSCQARFRYDDERFQGLPRKRFRCPKCAHVFEVENPAHQVAPVTVASMPRPVVPVAPPPPPPPVPAPLEPPVPPQVSARETSARPGLEDMHTSAGVSVPGIPLGYRFSLAFLNGPRASTVAVLQSAQTLIGREDGDIVTQDPECSRRHARVDIHSDGTVWLVDLGSTNGTFVDGVQVFSAVQLADRQEFTCGRSSFMMLIRREDPNMLV